MASLRILWATQEAENNRVRNLLFPTISQPVSRQQPPLVPESDDMSSSDSETSSNSSVSASANDSADEFIREPPNKKSRKGMRFRKRRILSLYRTQTGTK